VFKVDIVMANFSTNFEWRTPGVLSTLFTIFRLYWMEYGSCCMAYWSSVQELITL